MFPKTQQPPNCVIAATFFKMKADYLKVIYECLSGENGCLVGDKTKKSFIYEFKERKDAEIMSPNIKDDEVDLHDMEMPEVWFES